MHHRIQKIWGKTHRSFTIVVSNYYDVPLSLIEDTLIHEMIHYEIAYKNLKDTSAHGTLFRQRMEEINRNYHRDITVSKRMTDYAPRKSNQTETYLVLAIEMNDGSHLLSSVARTMLADLERQIKRVEKIRNFCWYITQDAYFRNFPKVRTLRARSVSAEFFTNLTAKMTLVKDKNGWVRTL
ncbi:hypothetical protein JCM15124A_19690 [Prevotella falsenii]